MFIIRTGAAADHGERKIEISNLKFDWQIGGDALQIKSDAPVRDFATNSHHRYKMQLDAKEIGRLVEALAVNANQIDSDTLRDVFRPRVADLLKLANLASNS